MIWDYSNLIFFEIKVSVLIEKGTTDANIQLIHVADVRVFEDFLEFGDGHINNRGESPASNSGR